MPITFACRCGKRLTVRDENAGKKAKCPKCGAVTMPPPVPAPKRPAPVVQDADEVIEDVDLEVIEDDIEVVEEVPAAAVHAGAPPQRVKANPAKAEKAEADTKKKKKKGKKKKDRSSGGGDGSLTQMYLERAERQLRTDQNRARAAGGWGADEDGGWTIGNVHITSGVLGAAGTLLLGLLGMATIGFFKDEFEFGPRLFIGSMVCTALGAVGVIAFVCFGAEED
jgi:ribosomal protein L12E/L44/L45/RPP1/RPP2